MKLDFDLPPWCDERHIYVMAGIEMVAYKLFKDKEFKVKTSRCSCCGDCCKGLSPRWRYGIKEDGSCNYLEADGDRYRCAFLIDRPYHCSVGMQHKGLHPNCTVEYK